MTSDYVTHVLFQLAWEAVEDLDDYMMGVTDTPESSDNDSDDREWERTCNSCDFACQTPKSWLAPRAAEEPKEAEPRRAPERKVTLGTCPHWNPRVMRVPDRDLLRY